MGRSLYLTLVGVAIFICIILYNMIDGIPDLSGMDLVQPTAEYEVDTFGFNSEVYEVTSKVNPAITCMMWMLDNGNAMGLDCYPTVGVSDVAE